MVPALPGNRGHLCAPGVKERFSLEIDGLALLRTDNVRSNPLARNAVHIREGVVIQQAHEAMEGIGLPLVGRSREE